MDTDDLSIETYKAIIETSERFHPDLTLQFGLLADYCNTDDDFLNEVESLITDWIGNWDLKDVMLDIFFEDQPSEKNFKQVLDKILDNITNTKQMPIEKRKFD